MELQTLLSSRQEEKESVESKKEDINPSEGSWCLYCYYYKLVRNSLELKSKFTIHIEKRQLDDFRYKYNHPELYDHLISTGCCLAGVFRFLKLFVIAVSIT